MARLTRRTKQLMGKSFIKGVSLPSLTVSHRSGKSNITCKLILGKDKTVNYSISAVSDKDGDIYAVGIGATPDSALESFEINLAPYLNEIGMVGVEWDGQVAYFLSGVEEILDQFYSSL